MTARALEIVLIDQRVGWLIESKRTWSLRFNPSWRERPDRRVFSLSSEAAGNKDIPGAPRLPNWFDNVRFEGALRAWIVDSEPGLPRGDDYALLARVGGDLMGGVTVHPILDTVPEVAPFEAQAPSLRIPGGRIHWSLAGVQLKLNLVPRGDKFSLPVHGEIGSFIAKFRDQRMPGVTVNEHVTMTWAAAAGLQVAENRLLEPGAIDELPEGLKVQDEPLLLVKRFDRHDGQRVHMEEFAQALDLAADQKYDRLGWRHHLRLLQRAAPMDVAEYLRRLLFVIASGNADAHHKNWCLVYPDGRQPRLAPAYDQVSIVALGEHHEWAEGLPFPLSKVRRWSDLRLEGLLRLLDDVGLSAFTDGDRVVERGEYTAWIQRALERIRDTLPEAPLSPGYRAALLRHWARTPLLRD